MSSFSSLVGALWYLRVTSLVGLIRSRLKRLRQPKYLAGAVVGALYFYWLFFRQTHRSGSGQGGSGSPVDALSADIVPMLGELGALVLLVVLAINWVIPRRAALPFSESEIAFLFPAPLSRRMLVQYRLLSAQFGIAFTALIFTAVFGRGHGAYQFIGWWLILALGNLHVTGTSFFYSRLLNPSMTTARKRALIVGTAAVIAVALLTWIWVAVPTPKAEELSTAADVARYTRDALHSGPMPWLLALPKLVVAPYFAHSTREFALAMLPALVLLVAHFFWVVHSEVAFEEASIARAQKRAARHRAHREGDWRGNVAVHKARTPPFTLAGRGRPELAFLWKNLVASGPLFRPRPMLALAVVLAGAAWWVTRAPGFESFSAAAFALGLVGLMIFLLFGPQIARQDLRTDLANADLLKTYPLRGWQIVLGEMLTPVVILTVLSWLALLIVYLLVPQELIRGYPAVLRIGAALGIALLVPPFLAIQVLVPNATTVLFPAWVQATRDRTERGVEVMGQRLIFVAGQFLVTALALVPPLILGALAFGLLQWFAGIAIAGAVAGVAMAWLLAVEAWLGIHWLGARFEKLDISSELRA